MNNAILIVLVVSCLFIFLFREFISNAIKLSNSSYPARQLYRNSVCMYVCLSVCPSVRHTRAL